MTTAQAIQTDRLAPDERILEVARELFCRDGIHATGIDRILTEAGASKMTLYSRFGSKEALLREVLVREGQAPSATSSLPPWTPPAPTQPQASPPPSTRSAPGSPPTASTAAPS